MNKIMLSEINDGDIVSVLKVPSSSWIDKAISFFEGSPIFHSFIAVWIDGELHALQMDPQKHNLVPIQDYKNNPLHVIRRPSFVTFNKEAIIKEGLKENYSFLGALAAGLQEYDQKIKYNSNTKFCSQFCIWVWANGGYHHFSSTILNPAMLEKEAIKNNLTVLEVF
jgi:hypothetical protein